MIPDARFTQWFCRTTVADGVITLDEGWKDPIIGDKVVNQMLQQQCDTREHSIRQTLIQMGWTPPKEEHEQPNP